MFVCATRVTRWCVVLVAAVALVGCGYAMPASYHSQGSGTPPSATGETTYYVDAERGRDSASGTSPATAWRTLARVDRGHYGGGDAILLAGGQRFAGTINLGKANLAGTSSANPLWIGSYGQGRATIQAPSGQDGLRAVNVAGVRVAKVDLAGRGNRDCQQRKDPALGDGAAGIRFLASHLNGTLDQGIAIQHVDVSGFCDGIIVASADNGSRISGVRVASVSAHDNGQTGIWAYDLAQSHYSIRDVTVSDTRAYRNAGRGGIALFGVEHGTVANSVAFANARSRGGGVGIWAFDANRIRITHDTSYANGSAAIKNDGDGFDLDRGVSNSVIEHSVSHDNGGVGYLVCSCARYGSYYHMRDNLVRDNVSRDDGSSGQSSLYVLGGEPMRGIDIVHDRVTSSAGAGPLVRVGASGRPYADLRFRDNSFAAGGGKRLLQLDPRGASGLSFESNTWRAIGGPFSVRWGHRAFSSLRSWQAATHVETSKRSNGS